MAGMKKNPYYFEKFILLQTANLYKIYNIIDIHINIEVLTTGLLIPSGTNPPPVVASSQ